jgi:hypothetical protein
LRDFVFGNYWRANVSEFLQVMVRILEQARNSEIYFWFLFRIGYCHTTYFSERPQQILYEHMMTARISALAKLCKIIVDAGHEVLDSFEFIDSCWHALLAADMHY